MALPLPFICLALATPLAAQTQGGVFASHNAIDSAVAGAGFGQSLDVIQDVNLDGTGEVIIGAPFEDVVGVSAAGAVHLRAGGGSNFAATFHGTVVNGLFGWSVANAGLCTGDSYEDILVGAPGENAAYIFDSFNGAEYLSVTGPDGSAFGWSVVSLGDLDADGIDDFAVGAPDDSPSDLAQAGSVFVHSGADGSLLRSFHGASAGDHLGYAITALKVAQVTAGVSAGSPPRLLAIGAPDTLLGGHVAVFDASTGGEIFSADGSVNTIGSSFGFSLTAISDADADGIEELAIGAPYYAPNIASFNVGQVKIYSTVANTELRAITGGGNFHLLGLQLGSADLDGDGFAELSVRSYKTGYGHIEIFDGVESTLLWEIEGSPEMAAVGTAMGGGLDLTNDGLPDLVCGAPLADTSTGLNAGRVAVYGIHTILSSAESSFDSPAGGFLTFQMDFPATEQFRQYLLLASGGTGPIMQDGVLVPLSNDRFLRRMVGGNPMFPGQQGQLDISGDAQVVFYVPPHLLDALVGTSLNFAVVSADGTGVRTSSVAVPVAIVSGSGS